MMKVGPQRRRVFLYPGEEVKPSVSPKLRLQGSTTRAVETGRMRLIVTAGLFGVAFAMIGLRLIDLMVLKDGPAVTASRSREIARAPIARSDILDRNGVIVATNLPTVNLYADTRKIPDAKAGADKLTAVLPDLEYTQVLKQLSSGAPFTYLRRNLTPAEQVAVNRLGIPGIYFEGSESRIYPHSALFAHVVGTTDTDNHGVAGVEKTFDNILSKREQPLALSLDVRVQHAVRESLAESITRFHAKAGSGVVLDVRSGEIISMVSLPDYDPKAIGTATEDARFNRATLGLYEMGSTFKIFTAAIGLDHGTANLDSRYDASEPIKVGRFTINDYHGVKRWVSLPELMIHSSNIGAAKMALEAGADVQQDYLRKLGLLSALRLELPEVGTPLYPKGKAWRDLSTITIAYGQGITVTPVHMASAVGAIVNGGRLIPPTLLRRAPGEIPEGTRVVSEKTSEAVRALMRMIVLYGSGKNANAQGYLVGGKTGSADKPGRGGYSGSNIVATFVGAFPIDAPQYVVLVLLDEPRGTKETHNFRTAGWNAAPTVSNIVAKIGPMLGVFPLGHEDNFQPLTHLIATYGPGETKNEYGGTPVVLKATAPAATPPVVHAVAPPAIAEEETTKVTVTRTTSNEPTDAIGGLIDDMSVQDIAAGASGGSGAAE